MSAVAVAVADCCALTSGTTLCGKCRKGKQFCLHHVPIDSTSAYLCSSCVLRLYPELFCPICYQIYESPFVENLVTCIECFRCTHLHCVMPKSPESYVCVACIDPDSFLCVADRQNDSDLEKVGKENSMENDKGRLIFLAAAEIVAVVKRKIADAASVEAKRKAALAAVAKQKALVALQYLSDVHKNENSRGIQADEGASMPVTVPGSNDYSSRELGAGHGRGSRGHAAGEGSRGSGRGRLKVHGLVAAGSSRGHGASRSDSDTVSDSETDTDTDIDLGADSVSDYVGSSRRFKRKHPS